MGSRIKGIPFYIGGRTMKTISTRVLLVVFSLIAICTCQAQTKINEKANTVFASVQEGKEILTTRDDFIERMSPFDRAARMKTDQVIAEDEFLAFVGRSTLAWNQDEINAVTSACQSLQPKLSNLKAELPKTLYFIKTTGKEEGNAAYTRGAAIILPEDKILDDPVELKRLVAHELFHVLSRNNPELKDQLYAAIGFEKCDELKFPVALVERKITNPDAPKNDHAIRVRVGNEKVWVAPILFSRASKYDTNQDNEFFDYLQFAFVVIAKGDDLTEATKTYDEKKPVLVGPNNISEFYEQIGKNTNYIIHPEEILADNFALLMLNNQEAPSPEILEKIDKILFS
jgi:hypothetical protein